MKKMTASLVVVAILVLAAVIPALADATITITGQSLVVVPQGVSFAGITLDGTNKPNQAGSTTQWTAKDPTGTGAGWHVTVSATNFANAGGKTIAVEGFDMKMNAVSKLDESSNALPSVAPTFDGVFAPLSAAPQQILSAALDEGMGYYGFTPDFQLDVPASTYAGDYTSTLTVQIVAAP